MTPTQCRIARAALEWSETDLAKAANVGISTISRFELSQTQPQSASLEAIRHALETAGIIFLNEGEMTEGGVGVKLKNSVSPDACRRLIEKSLYAPLRSVTLTSGGRCCPLLVRAPV